MKRGALEHPKMLELGLLLHLPPYAADGIMDSLVQWASKYAPAGNVGKYPDETIARGIGWDRDPAELIASLVKSGWIEEHKQHRLIIHDWYDHADDTIHRLLARSGVLFSDGRIPKTSRLSEKEKPSAEAALKKAAACARRAHKVRQSSPVLSGQVPSCPGVPPSPSGSATTDTWTAYSTAYRRRYQTDPIRNATVNSQMAAFVKRVPVADAPMIAAFYVANNSAYYASRGHSIGCLLQDAEKLGMEWATNRRINTSQARKNEETSANPFLAIVAEERAAKQ